MEEESWWRKHRGTIMREESWRSNHGVEEQSWLRNQGGAIMVAQSCRRNHGVGFMSEESWRSNHGGGTMEEQSWRRHLESIWEASVRHLGGIWEAFGNHLRELEAEEASGRHLEAKSQNCNPYATECNFCFSICQFHELFLRAGVIDTMNYKVK